MKRNILLLLSLLSVLSYGQAQDCDFDQSYTVNAPSGLKMRKGPTVNSEVETYVFFDSIVEACSQSFGSATFEEITGDWIYVRYKDHQGYMFDGFLQPLTQNTLLAPINDSVVLDTLLPIDNGTIAIDSSFAEAIVDSLFASPDTNDVAEPLWTWERTERDNLPATGRLDSKQIQDLAVALRHEDLRMDSLIGFLHKLPTIGSQDSVIAWIDAGMPEVEGGGVIPRRRTTSEAATPSETTPRTQTRLNTPPPIQVQMATEALNYCGDISDLDPSMNWYGVFPDERMGNYHIQRVDLEILVSRTRLGSSMEYDIRNSTGEVSHFLFGINRRLDTVKPYQLRPDRFFQTPGKLFPGQQLETYAYYNRPSASNVFISATGRVIEVGVCPVIEDYALKINTQGPTGEIIQNITPLFETMGECGMPEVYWFGDLNQDNYPEIIYVAATQNKNQFTLLMSNVNLPAGLYEVGSTWTLERCD
ncbi:MAG: SH3 domain-containing protein [Flavobacteriia bacterium]|nr:SH3 domain-containing protein [Flavobacteriia bacterium]